MCENTKVEKHIVVLDGIRAVAMVIVVWYHFWQQSWLTPKISVPVNLTKYIGITQINIEGFVRYGFIFVDLLILLSAFCNFYPYARSIMLGEEWPDAKNFYKKRAARILPSYYLSLLVMTIVLVLKGTSLNGAFWKDLLAHVLCVGPFFAKSYLSTYFNGVLWTVQIEVLYYVLMPWLAKLFRRHPIVTTFGLWGVGLISANYIAYNMPEKIRTLGNHFLSFAGCYANGMLLCMLFITLKKRELENSFSRMAASLVAVGCLPYLSGMMGELSKGNLQVVQIQQRFELSLVFSCFILAVCFACKGIKVIFANPLMVFIAGISYNLYIWHQYIAVELKSLRIPYWEGDNPPNMTGDRAWMWKYQILIIVVSLVVATAMTYLVERPITKRILRKRN